MSKAKRRKKVRAPEGHHIYERMLLAPENMERTAVMLIPLPASAVFRFDPTWRFVGWSDEVEINIKKHPRRLNVDIDE